MIETPTIIDTTIQNVLTRFFFFIDIINSLLVLTF